MQRRWIWLGTAAVAIIVIALIVRDNSPRLPPRVEPPAPPPQAAATAPAPAAPAATPGPTVPSFDIVKVDPGGNAVIAGRAAPGAKVNVLDGSKSIGQVTADGRGEWVLVPTAPMAPGERQLTLEAADPKTGATTKSTDTVALAVAAPVAGQQTPGTVAVLLPGNENRPAQALQVPNAAGGLSLDTAEYGQGGALMLSGHARAGALLRLYADNQLVAVITADPDGKWSSVSPRPQTNGKVELRVDELAADGSVDQRVEQPFEPQTAAAQTGSYTVESGNSLWVIARKTYGNGLQYTVIFGANKARIRNPNLIYPGQVIALPKS